MELQLNLKSDVIQNYTYRVTGGFFYDLGMLADAQTDRTTVFMAALQQPTSDSDCKKEHYLSW